MKARLRKKFGKRLSSVLEATVALQKADREIQTEDQQAAQPDPYFVDLLAMAKASLKHADEVLETEPGE